MKTLMPILLLVTEKHKEKLSKFAKERKGEYEKFIDELACNTLDRAISTWKFFDSDKIEKLSLNSVVLPFKLTSGIEIKDVAELRERFDNVFTEILSVEFENNDFDFNEFSVSDKMILSKFFNALSLQFSVRYSKRLGDPSVSYFKDNKMIASAIEDMTETLSKERTSFKVNQVFAVVDIIFIDKSIEEFMESIYDRYPTELCNFTFSSIFKLAYTSDDIVENPLRFSNKVLPSDTVNSMIGHITELSLYDYEDENECLREFGAYISKTEDQRNFEVRKKVVESLIENGVNLDPSLFDEEYRVNDKNAFEKAILESDFDCGKVLDSIRSMGINTEFSNDIIDEKAMYNAIKSNMSPEEFARFEERVREILEELSNESDEDDIEHPSNHKLV